MHFIDSHAHLFMLVKEKGITLDEIFSEMKENRVLSLLNVSGSKNESFFFKNEVLPAAEKMGVKVYHSCGIHPHSASKYVEDDLKWLREESPFMDAVGEVGLDLHYNFSPPKKQEEVLLKMLEASLELSKPVIIHGRCGEERIIDVLKQNRFSGKKVLFHCFTGDKKTAFEIIDNGWLISFSGIVTFKKAEESVDILKSVSVDNILFETDSPFLAPHPFRGKLNTPAKVKYVYQFASDILKIDMNELAHKIENNFKLFFS